MNAEKILPVRELQPRLERIDTLRPATGPLPMPKVRRTKEDKIVRATKRSPLRETINLCSADHHGSDVLRNSSLHF